MIQWFIDFITYPAVWGMMGFSLFLILFIWLPIAMMVQPKNPKTKNKWWE